MNLEPLPAIILAMAEQRSLAAVLKTIIDAVARQPGVALARLWLRETDSHLSSVFGRRNSLAEPAPSFARQRWSVCRD